MRPVLCLHEFFFPALTDPNAAASQQAILQQQLSILAYSPYGDSPLFRNQLADPKKKEEVCSEIKPLRPLLVVMSSAVFFSSVQPFSISVE